MPVHFFFPEKINLTNRRLLKEFVLTIFKEEKKLPENIRFVFCSDEYLRNINRKYLDHDNYTDIITFDLSAPGAKTVDAEIYISVDTVRDNAKRFKVSINMELHRVIFHGVLHLCGYKDKTNKDQQLMTKKEDYYLNRYF